MLQPPARYAGALRTEPGGQSVLSSLPRPSPPRTTRRSDGDPEFIVVVIRPRELDVIVARQCQDRPDRYDLCSLRESLLIGGPSFNGAAARWHDQSGPTRTRSSPR